MKSKEFLCYIYIQNGCLPGFDSWVAQTGVTSSVTSSSGYISEWRRLFGLVCTDEIGLVIAFLWHCGHCAKTRKNYLEQWKKVLFCYYLLEYNWMLMVLKFSFFVLIQH